MCSGRVHNIVPVLHITKGPLDGRHMNPIVPNVGRGDHQYNGQSCGYRLRLIPILTGGPVCLSIAKSYSPRPFWEVDGSVQQGEKISGPGPVSQCKRLVCACAGVDT